MTVAVVISTTSTMSKKVTEESVNLMAFIMQKPTLCLPKTLEESIKSYKTRTASVEPPVIKKEKQKRNRLTELLVVEIPMYFKDTLWIEKSNNLCIN